MSNRPALKKSGRESPYFFNAGRFDSGSALAELAACYADAIDEAGVEFDVLFGPAYKGIPLATAVACEYARRGRDLPLAFNRKEAKAHGEGGTLIGAPLAGKRVLIIDDVITAGTAIREALGIIRETGGIPAGIVIALDRQERATEAHAQSAAQAVSAEHALRVDWPDGWGLVRASNTTPVLVLRFDGDSRDALTRIQGVFREQLLALRPDLKLPF